MVKEKKPGKLGEFVARHGEKAVLAAAVAPLLAYLVYGVFMKKEDGSASRVKQETERIITEMEKEHPQMKAPDPVPVVADALGPWNEVVTAKPAPDWTGSYASELKPEAVAPPPPVPKNTPVIPEIAMAGKPEIAIDGVSIKWAAGKPLKFTVRDRKVAKPITRFSVERAPGGTDKWEVLDEKLPATATSYRDTTITPKMKYSYRVTSWCDDKEYTEFHKSPKGMTVGTAEPVATLGIWKIRPITMMKGQAYIEIEKFEPPHGAVKTAHIQFAGEKIGWWKNKPEDSKASSRHLGNTATKSVEIDFNTGMKLVSVEPRKFTKTIRKCVPKFAPNGPQIGCDQVEEEASIQLTEMTYIDDNGETQYFRNPDPDKDTRMEDKLCPNHGGKKAEAPEPKEDEKAKPEK